MRTKTEYMYYKFAQDYKEIDDKPPGTFEALGAKIGNIDLGGDRINKGAFTKTLKENPTVTYLWQHDRKEPIGKVTGKEIEGGLFTAGSHNLDMIENTMFPAVPNAHKARSLLKRKDINGFSIGYRVVKAREEKLADGKWIWNLDEIKWLELSAVTFPMNPGAILQNIKSEDDLLLAIRENIKDELFMRKLFTLLKEIEPGASTHFLTEPENVLKGHSENIKKILGG